MNHEYKPDKVPANAEAKPSKKTLEHRKKSIQKIAEDPHKAFSAFCGTPTDFLELLPDGLHAGWNPAKKIMAVRRPPQVDENTDAPPPPLIP